MDPNTQTLSQAATSNNVNGALQSLLLSRAHAPEESKQLTTNRQEALGGYQEALQSSPTGNFTPTEQGMYSWVEQMGKMNPFAALTTGIAAGGQALRDSQIANRQSQIQAAKVGYDDAKDLDRMDEQELLALQRGIGAGRVGQGKFIQFKDDKGNLYIMNNATGEKQTIPASQTPLWTKAFQLGLQKAVETRNEDPESFATDFADRAIRNSPAASTNVTTVQEPQTPVQPPSMEFSVDMTPGKIQALINRMTDPEAKAEAQLGFDAKYGKRSEALVPAPVKAKTPGLAPLDLRQDAQDKGYGTEEGKGLWQERKQLTELSGANAKLISQLNMLEHLYQNPDIPEGELGPQIQGLRSGLKSLGIDVAEGVGLGDMAGAIGSNMALAMKNADGHNLLPGAMSNYEDQLLQKMAPTLSMTQQGRLGMIRFMKMMAASNMRLAQEADILSKDNKDQLPASWSRRKERVMLEEMARMKKAADQLTKQFGGR